MYISRIAAALFAASAMAAEVSEVWTDATSFGAMLVRGEAMEKRQGYVPGQRSCGTGRTCEEACGAGSVQCPSNDRNIHCHYPATGTSCCTDGTGNACRAGFYCTTDGRSNTYCCPNGIQNAECARLYSLTISLIRTSLAALPSASSRVPGLLPLLSTDSSRIYVTSTRSSIVMPTSSASIPTPLIMPSNRVAGASTTTNTPQTGAGAAKAKGAAVGIVALAGAAGILL